MNRFSSFILPALEMPAMNFCRCIVNVMILSLAVTAADAGSPVEVVGDKCVLVDGEPFFPVGIYSASVDDFPKLAIERLRKTSCKPTSPPVKRMLSVPGVERTR
jgi:hypothetical protein